MNLRRITLLFWVMVFAGDGALPVRAASGDLTFCCSAENDVYRALRAGKYPRLTNTLEAIQRAAAGTAVLVLADGYPGQSTRVEPEALALAKAKGVKMFIEYPAALPGVEVGAPRGTSWERLVVAGDRFSPRLPRGRILAAQDCHFTPVTNEVRSEIVVARVAGYDRAVYGLPAKEVFPILFDLPDAEVTVATTKLSGFVTGRYGPAREWRVLWEEILKRMGLPGKIELEVEPVVGTAFGPGERLPRNFESQVFRTAAGWFRNSGLLVTSAEREVVHASLLAGRESFEPPGASAWNGDGVFGMLEGFASGIRHDGTQPRRLPLRADCNAESAMVLALDGRINRERRSGVIASNLLDFVYFNSGMCRGVRADPKHPAFGLIGWGDVHPLWMIANYGDDNARVMLATAVAGAALETGRWEEQLMRALLANLRTTGKQGFRGDRIDLAQLEQNGWRAYFEGKPVNYSPHFEAYLWAAYLWAYRQSGYGLFLERAKTAITMTMSAYPDGWRWRSHLERAHMLLCLAWLVRIDDTPEHRRWLSRVAADLLADQQPSGSIHDRLGSAHTGFYQAPRSNEDYGTTETPLIQENGDPVSDQLYTTGFALLGLHEAAGATGDAALARAENKLAEYLCRIQTRSRKVPCLHGTWFRAFDDRRWEAWASSADVGWGAWSIESGWGQAWITAVLGLREKGTTVWEFAGRSGIRKHLEKCRRELELP